MYSWLRPSRYSSGTRPGPRGAGPLGKEVGDVEQWVFPQVVLTEEEKVGILGAVVRLLVEILFANHFYTSGANGEGNPRGGPLDSGAHVQWPGL